MLAVLSWGCSECHSIPILGPDWSGEVGDGVAVGCECTCLTTVVCYETTLGACEPTWVSRTDPGPVKVETADGIVFLTDLQLADLRSTCAAQSDFPCDTAE